MHGSAAAGRFPDEISVADFNGDGRRDFVVTGKDVSVVLGNGDGTFGAPLTFGAGADGAMIAVADVNHDGTNDLVLPNSSSNDITFVLNRSTCASAGGITPDAGPDAGGQSTVISGTNLAEAASVTFDGVPGIITANTPASITVTAPAHPAGTVDVAVFTAGGTATLDGSYTYVVPLTAPANAVATAASPTQVNVTWSTVTGATTYRIERKQAGGGFTEVGTSATDSFVDTTVAAGTAYLYRVRATNAWSTSANSLEDLATTVIITDGELNGVRVKAVHLSELRAAVNAVRALAGLTAATFGAAGPGTTIEALHVTELRVALDAALTALSRPSGGYTTGAAAGFVIRAVHFQELCTLVS